MFLIKEEHKLWYKRFPIMTRLLQSKSKTSLQMLAKQTSLTYEYTPKHDAKGK